MDMSLFIMPDAVFGQTPNAQPVGGMHAEVLQPNPVEENDLPWWHTIDEMIANLPVDDGQKAKLKAYAQAISDPDNAPGYMADVGGIDGDVLRIVTTGARKIARQKQINASMDKSMTAAQMMRETVRKAGEGSKGGKIIGHSSKTGKPVYASHGDIKTMKRTADKAAADRDHHHDESVRHQKEADQHHAAGNHEDAAAHRQMADYHRGKASSLNAFHHEVKNEISSLGKSVIATMRETVRKAGEGSRGGHILGHTKSGKPVYSSNTKSEGYTKQDHHEAAQMHRSEGRDRVALAEKAEDKGDKHKAKMHHEAALDSYDRAQHHADVMHGRKAP